MDSDVQNDRSDNLNGSNRKSNNVDTDDWNRIRNTSDWNNGGKQMYGGDDLDYGLNNGDLSNVVNKANNRYSDISDKLNRISNRTNMLGGYNINDLNYGNKIYDSANNTSEWNDNKNYSATSPMTPNYRPRQRGGHNSDSYWDSENNSTPSRNYNSSNNRNSDYYTGGYSDNYYSDYNSDNMQGGYSDSIDNDDETEMEKTTKPRRKTNTSKTKKTKTNTRKSNLRNSRVNDSIFTSTG